MNQNKNKVLLFGAGKMGAHAITSYGEGFIDGFVDSNPEKCGKAYMGKPVVHFTEMCENKDQYDIIIANMDIEGTKKQLMDKNIAPVGVFLYRAAYSMQEIAKEAFSENAKKIGVYGCDIYAAALLHYLSKNKNDFSISGNILLIDRNESEYCGSSWRGQKVYRLSEVHDQVDKIIIAVPKYNRAIAERLRRELGELDAKEILIINPFKSHTIFSPDAFVISRYGSATSGLTESEFNDSTKTRINTYFRDVMNAFVDEAYKAVPLFSFIELETHNRCNGTCTFCPVNHRADTRPYQKMEKPLFKNIIDQLSRLNYSGHISLYSNNEPFMDERLIEFSALMREKLPNAYIYIYTNGTLLTVDKFITIYPLLDEMVIDNYNQSLKLIPSVQKIYDFCENNAEYKKKLTIHLRLEDEILSTRGGNSPNRRKIESYGDVKCARPFQQLVIRPTGEVSLCCNDALGKYTMGDLRKESILDIWYGEKFNKLRNAISKGRSHFDDCRFCDIFTLG